jgi:hypothetical protein
MIFRNKFVTGASLLLILFLTTGSSTKMYQGSYYIMVAKVYKNQKCGTGSFSNAAGYDLEKGKGNFNYQEVEAALKKRAARMNYAAESEVFVEFARRQFACVIMYEKEHSGWGCSTSQYAVGFGDNRTKAEEDAVQKMRNSYKKVSYRVEREIDASTF